MLERRHVKPVIGRFHFAAAQFVLAVPFALRRLMPQAPTAVQKVKDALPRSALLLRVGGAAGLTALLAFVIAPVIWKAALAGVGLLILGVISIMAIGVFQALPLLAQKWENRLLVARKAEARAHPIEQLQNFLLAKHQQVQAFKRAVAQLGAQILTMEDMLVERRRGKPGADTSKKEHSIGAMKAAHAVLVRKYERAERALQELEDTIEDKQFDWKFAQVGQEALQKLNATSGQAILDQMLTGEAFDSVRDNFNLVFSELELEANKLDSTGHFSFGSEVLDLPAIQIPQSDRVSARK